MPGNDTPLTERMRRVVAATATLSVRQFQLAVAKTLKEEAEAFEKVSGKYTVGSSEYTFFHAKAQAFLDAANAVMDLNLVEP